MRAPSASPAKAPSRDIPFDGLGAPFLLIALGVLGLPFVLRGLGVLTDQWAGIIFSLGLTVLCGAGATWVVLDAGRGWRLGLAALTLGAAVALSSGFPLVRGLLPTKPMAAVTLHEGEQRPLSGLAAGGDFDLVVHAEIAGSPGAAVHARYALVLHNGGHDQTLGGRFDSSRGRARVGRRAVAVTRPPREWERHLVHLAPGSAVARLERADAPLGRQLELEVYRHSPSWPFVVAAGGLTILAGLIAAQLDRRRWRHLIVALATATITSAVGCHWTWARDALNPLLLATVVGLVGAWLFAQILARLTALTAKGHSTS